MSAVTLRLEGRRERLGLKGPRAAEWLAAQGVDVPPAANTSAGDAVWVARLGASEFFVEQGAGGDAVTRLAGALRARPPGVYPVPREDCAFVLGGEEVHAVLAQVCSLDFAALPWDARPVIMTLMIGIAVLVAPECVLEERRYRIWCDPTYAQSLIEAVGAVVAECGGTVTGAWA